MTLKNDCICVGHGHYRDSKGECALCTCEYFMPEAPATTTLIDHHTNKDRPEVLAHRQAAVALKAKAEEMDSLADWWASLEDHQHVDGFCEDELCYQRYKDY